MTTSGYNSYDHGAWRPKQIGGRSYFTDHGYDQGQHQASPTHPPPPTHYIPRFLNGCSPAPNVLDSIFNILNDTMSTIVSAALRNIMPVLAVQLQAVAHWPISPIKRQWSDQRLARHISLGRSPRCNVTVTVLLSWFFHLLHFVSDRVVSGLTNRSYLFTKHRFFLNQVLVAISDGHGLA